MKASGVSPSLAGLAGAGAADDADAGAAAGARVATGAVALSAEADEAAGGGAGVRARREIHKHALGPAHFAGDDDVQDARAPEKGDDAAALAVLGYGFARTRIHAGTP